MRAVSRNETSLVVAAQAGDPRALDELATTYLPLVYTIVRRALGGHPDADDVVQETMVRVLTELRTLSAPAGFRPWLVTIAVRQARRYLHGRQAVAGRYVALDELAGMPDTGGDFEGLTSLRMQLSDQRRQIVRAGRWLDPDDQVLLSLWWLATMGRLTRVELATALGMSTAHAAVRIQRMRNQLEVSRSVVAALDAAPRCAGLAEAVADWDGSASPLWRKRIARHTRSCAACARAAAELVAPERLLVGFALLPVPGPLAAAVLGNTVLGNTALTGTVAGAASVAVVTGTATAAGSGAVGGGLIAQVAQIIGAHPLAAALAAGTLAAGAVVTTARPPSPPSAPPAVIAEPASAPAPATSRPATVPATPSRARPGPSLSSPAGARPVPATPAPRLAAGSVSLESLNDVGLDVTTDDGGLGVLRATEADDAVADRQRATFEVVTGLADHGCVSLRAPDGRYLRHKSWRLNLDPYEDSDLYRGDATFCIRAGTVAGSVSLESSNYPHFFLRHRGDELWVDQADGTAGFSADASFLPRPALAR
jgi:RNA polymerase sigma factor (sigma-70 family)